MTNREEYYSEEYYPEEIQEAEPSKKKKKKKKRKKKRYFLKFLLFIVFCIAMGFFLSSSFFDIQKLDVANNSYYTSEQVLEKSGAKIGTNIFALDAKEVKKALMKDPYIKNMKVKRRLPGSVTLDVLERKEFASIPFGQEFIVIDDEGLVLRMSNVNLKLTQLSGMTLKKVEPGKPLEVEENAVFTDTLSMLKEVEKNELFFKRVDVSNVIIKAFIFDNLSCEGTPENIKNNLTTLQGVLQTQYDQGIQRGVLKIVSEGEVTFDPSGE